MRGNSIHLDALRYLAAAADAGNFGRAAKILGVRASTVSRSVAHTEDQLGVTIFERGHFGIRLTEAGKAVMVRVRRTLAEMDSVRAVAQCSGSGKVGHIRIGVRMPPVGRPVQQLLRSWREEFPQVDLSFHELNEREILAGIEERRLDVAFMSKHTLWPHAVASPLYREELLAALPREHALAHHKRLKWRQLRDETFLVQGWDESHTARELYASFLGSGTRFRTHSAGKQTIMALIGAGFGVTLVTRSQSQVRFPNVVYRMIDEENASVEVELVWIPQSEEAAVGRFVTFMREQTKLRRLV